MSDTFYCSFCGARNEKPIASSGDVQCIRCRQLNFISAINAGRQDSYWTVAVPMVAWLAAAGLVWLITQSFGWHEAASFFSALVAGLIGLFWAKALMRIP